MHPPLENGTKAGLESPGTAYGCARDFLDNRHVYAVISPRARGLSVGVNLCPDKHCNFACCYCEVNREEPARASVLDIPAMVSELERTIRLVRAGGLAERSSFRNAPPSLLELRHVTLSGDGEPTLCPNFVEAVEAIIHLRASGRLEFFKLVLVTNTTGLDQPGVAEGLRLLTPRDEIWAKFEAGTQEYMNRVNRPDCSIEQVMAKILHVAQQRPVVIQSLFPSIDGIAPSASEIEEYVRRLRTLKSAGAQISLVQIYSATRPTPHAESGHLPLRTLTQISRRVPQACGLRAEVF
jgi:wyosine [tRNA(Phe)-imidazoG37] synthetase (radical SAM superfamily)